jgi:hypothetical protein
MTGNVRLIVTDNSTAARTMADRLANGKARVREVHRIPVFETDGDGGPTCVIAIDGLLSVPRGDPPVWVPERRAPARALERLARDADRLVLDVEDDLLAVQLRQVAGRGAPGLIRTARMGTPGGRSRHLDDLAADAAAFDLEVAAVVAAYMAPLDPRLGVAELAILGRATGGPLGRASLAPAFAAAVLAERGYLVDDPAFLSPAGQLVSQSVDPALLGRGPAASITGWRDAVLRGTLPRASALARLRDLIGGLQPAEPEAGLDAGRLVGRCPECDEWMGGARRRLRCLGCGMSYRIPSQVELLAVPGASCPACEAPMTRPVIRGRRDEPRCPDTTGCPTRLREPVGA